MSMNNDGFVLVSKKKRAKPRVLRPYVNEQEHAQESVENCLTTIYRARDILQECPRHRSMQLTLESIQNQLNSKVSRIVCYGLGLPSQCRIARYQTGLLILLQQFLEVEVEIYDPLFTSRDVEILNKLSFTILDENEEGKRQVNEATLFYMPHCGTALYNNLVWANWNAEALPKCIIVGNSFSTIVQNIPSRLLSKHYNYIFLVADLFCEYPCRLLERDSDIFNDISIHYWKQNNNMDLISKLLSCSSEPIYDENDAEFIRRKK